MKRPGKPKSGKVAFAEAVKKAKKLGGAKAMAHLDAVADKLVERDPKWAAEAFRAARARGPTAIARYERFASHGALDVRDVLAIVEEEGKKPDVLARIAVEAIANGGVATMDLVKALQKAKVLVPVFAGWLRRGAKIDLDLWLFGKEELRTCLEADATLHEAALKVLTRSSKGFDLVVSSGIAGSLKGDAASDLADRAMRIAHEDVNEESIEELRGVLAPIAKSIGRPLSAIPDPNADGDAGTASWDRQLLDPAVIEVALEVGLSFRLPAGAPETYTFWLYQWMERDLAVETDTLERVAKHPFFGRVLVASFFPTRETKDNVGKWLERAVKMPSFAPVFEALGQRARSIAETWPVGALDVLQGWLEGLCQPAVFERAPAIAEGIASLDAARLLRNQLRAGIMDEWGWPAHDEATAHVTGDTREWVHTSGPFPHHVVCSREAKRVIAYGPDGIVLDRKYEHPGKRSQGLRSVWFAEGDVLAVAWTPEVAHWVVSGGKKSFAAQAYGFFDIACDGQLVTRSGTLFPKGTREWPKSKKNERHASRAWFDGETWYAVTQETVLRADGTPDDGERDRVGIWTFDPKTGEVGPGKLPAWMKGLLEGDDEGARLIAHIQSTFLCPVPERASRSPLGAKNGFGGFALYMKKGEVIAERIDGGRAPGLVNGQYVVGLITFPERDGKLYPLVQSAFDFGIAMPDGTTPLVPIDRVDTIEYWGGTVPLPLVYWHLLEPRDPEASRALARCSDEAARAILEHAKPTDYGEPEEVMDYGNMQAVLVAKATDDGPVTPALEDAIRRALPEVRHPRMVRGVAGIARAAARLEPVIERLKGHLRKPVVESSLHNVNVKALADLFDHQMHWWIEKLGTQLGQQILDVADYLLVANDEDSRAPRTPARTVFPWELLLSRIGEVMYRVLASATPKSVRAELQTVLAFWRTTPFANEAKRTRLVSFAMPPCKALDGLDREHPDRLVTFGESRYFVRFRAIEHGKIVVRGIEATKDGAFHLPEGAVFIEAIASDARFDAASMQKTLDLLEQRGRVPHSPETIARLGEKAKLGRGAATLLWSAGLDPWLLGDKACARLELDRKTLQQGEREIAGARLREIYAKAMPDDPDGMYAIDLADRLASAWAQRA